MISLRLLLETGPVKVDRELHVGTSDSLGSTREVGLRPHCKLGSQDPETEGSEVPRLQA